MKTKDRVVKSGKWKVFVKFLFLSQSRIIVLFFPVAFEVQWSIFSSFIRKKEETASLGSSMYYVGIALHLYVGDW